MNPLPSRNRRTVFVMAWRVTSTFWRLGRRRSRYRYRRRRFSATSVSSSIMKGGVFDSFRTVSSVTITSISPVGSFVFVVFSGRGETFPVTAMTYSLRTSPAILWASAATSGLKTTWVMPSRSRRSTKISPPWSRRVWTQPINVTCRPNSRLFSSPQVCVFLLYFTFHRSIRP